MQCPFTRNLLSRHPFRFVRAIVTRDIFKYYMAKHDCVYGYYITEKKTSFQVQKVLNLMIAVAFIDVQVWTCFSPSLATSTTLTWDQCGGEEISKLKCRGRLSETLKSSPTMYQMLFWGCGLKIFSPLTVTSSKIKHYLLTYFSAQHPKR